MAVTMEQVVATYEKAQAIHDIRNLVGRMNFYFSTYDMKKMIGLFSKRDDICIAMPWGCYDHNVEDPLGRLFLQDYGDRSDPATYEALRGCNFMMALDSEMIRIADDGETAHCMWQSEGIETYGYNIFRRDQAGDRYWLYIKYGIDFIKEDGEWKIWHLACYVLFRCPWDKCWVNGYPYRGYLVKETHTNRHPLVSPHTVLINSAYPPDQPEPPMPYKTFADIAPGYGYDLTPYL